MSDISRRNFIKSTGMAVGAPMYASLMAMQAAAEAASTDDGYKALVCVYLAGGNDSFNTVLYTSDRSADRAVYESMRAPIMIPSSRMTPLGVSSGTGQGMALNDQLPTLAAWFNGQGNYNMTTAIVANVGPLLRPSTKDTDILYKPTQLFSHNDQTSTWLTGGLEGQSPGWGGKSSGQASTAYPAVGGTAPTGALSNLRAISFTKRSSFCSAQPVMNFVADRTVGIMPIARMWDANLLEAILTTPTGVKDFDEGFLFPLLNGDYGVSNILVGGVAQQHVLEKEYNKILSTAKDDWIFLKRPPYPGGTARLPAVDDTTHYTTEAKQKLRSGNELWDQLAMVANIVLSQQKIGLKRQVFFVELGGFDTHSGQNSGGTGLSNHDGLLGKVDEALRFFYETLGSDSSCVTTFTASEFGRKLLNNGDGSDHGWGGHHFVVGGSQINGGKIFGRIPALTLNPVGDDFESPQLIKDGTMVPEVSVEQFAWPLAKWFGVPDSARAMVFPNYFAPATNIPLDFMIG